MTTSRDIQQGSAAYLARTYTTKEIYAMYNQSQQDAFFSKSLEIAANIKNGVYGVQLRLEF